MPLGCLKNRDFVDGIIFIRPIVSYLLMHVRIPCVVFNLSVKALSREGKRHKINKTYGHKHNHLPFLNTICETMIYKQQNDRQMWCRPNTHTPLSTECAIKIVKVHTVSVVITTPGILSSLKLVSRNKWLAKVND